MGSIINWYFSLYPFGNAKETMLLLSLNLQSISIFFPFISWYAIGFCSIIVLNPISILRLSSFNTGLTPLYCNCISLVFALGATIKSYFKNIFWL